MVGPLKRLAFPGTPRNVVLVPPGSPGQVDPGERVQTILQDQGGRQTKLQISQVRDGVKKHSRLFKGHVPYHGGSRLVKSPVAWQPRFDLTGDFRQKNLNGQRIF